ncbi:CHAT domain-containing protein [Suillus clintonianus]|uniref:CHAT domain-containing protein n=1 Tax=Suillus clintonianus TaxID=1904413 RepID=UPI001B882CB1|nr:CHAT domain-containing protein [Suillus clintonianus]KAG2144551.1 CHAT domain-containing protein [Suillus clintonianus]
MLTVINSELKPALLRRRSSRLPIPKCIWNAAHTHALVIVTANVDPGAHQWVDIEILDSTPHHNICLSKHNIKGETRLAVTAHGKGEVGVCFKNYLSPEIKLDIAQNMRRTVDLDIYIGADAVEYKLRNCAPSWHSPQHSGFHTYITSALFAPDSPRPLPVPIPFLLAPPPQPLYTPESPHKPVLQRTVTDIYWKTPEVDRGSFATPRSIAESSSSTSRIVSSSAFVSAQPSPSAIFYNQLLMISRGISAERHRHSIATPKTGLNSPGSRSLANRLLGTVTGSSIGIMIYNCSSQASPALSMEIRASYELDRMLGNGEVIGKLKTSWHELLDHGDEPFELSFPPVCGVRPSLTLKAVVVHTCDNQHGTPFDSLVDCKIARDTDAGQVRFAQYMTHKRVSHLNNALKQFQLVLDQCPVGHPDHATALTNLAWARLLGCIQRDLQDIDNITSLFRDALALRPQGHPDHTLSLYCLIRTLNWHYNRERTAIHIHESAQLCCKLLPLCPEGTYLRSIGLDSEVNYVIPQCNNIPIDASNEGIHLRRNMLKLCPSGHQHRPRTLDKLAQAVEAHFDRHGSIGDLEESIQLGREAVSLFPEEHLGRDTYLNNLAFSLNSRFNHQGKFHDLDEAITLYKEALRLRPVGHECRDSSLDNLGLALRNCFIEHDDIDDITRAISLHREALTLCPSGNSNRDTTLNNIALTLQTRFATSHVNEESAEDLNEAIDLYRECLRLQGHNHPTCHATLLNLSSALCYGFTRTQKNEDFKEAIDICGESLLALPSLHPHRYFSYLWLQEAYLHRFPNRIVTARKWVTAAEQHSHTSMLEAYNTCFDLLDSHLVTRSSTISRREAATAAASRNTRSLPVDAASCAVRLDNLRHAIELVEWGRGQQWSLASRLRSPLKDLESTNPILAHKFSELSKSIKYRKLMEQWDATVAQIRNLPAFSRFLLPPLYAELQVAARHGPVIIFIASQYSCSAIIVPTSGEPHHVAFPRITLADVEQLKHDFAMAIRHTALWDKIMLPIINVLQDDLKLQRQSRIWLCPTAAFMSIPLHAANPFQSRADRSGPEACLEDIFICPYTPTLSALIRSRQTMETCIAQTFAAIGQGESGADQGKVLPAVNIELELVHELIPPNVKLTNLSKDEATQAGALNALRHNTWVHLACHGKQDLEQPYNSSFAMRDKPLALLDIMENNSPQAKFTFLSACHTAVGDEVAPDEAIHLAAGLQFSGFKSIVGTLWGFNDALAKHFVEAFYEKMFEDMEDGVMDCTKAAHAVNHARDSVKTKVPLEQIIVFVHIASSSA